MYNLIGESSLEEAYPYAIGHEYLCEWDIPVGLSHAPSPTIEPEELARIVESEEANEGEQS